MTKWEYRYINKEMIDNLERTLNEFGTNGWELVHYSYHNGYTTAIFKRLVS